MPDLAERYSGITERVRQEAVKAGRNPDSVRVLAVSKTFPAEDIAELYRHGCREFGENRVPELLAKAAVLPPDIRWHMIGQLQANKVRKVLPAVSMIHSVDSLSLLERLDRIAGELDRHPGFLLEVNVSGEASKSGCTPAELPGLAEQAANCKNISWQGLMTMAPQGAEEEELLSVFGSLRNLRDGLSRQYRLPLAELSMGMSGDYPAAVQCGATIVRIGSAVFGHRDYTV